MINDGWEPLPPASPRIPHVRANAEQIVSPDGPTNESAARRRFRSAKERQVIEGAAAPVEKEDPFDEPRSTSNARDFDRPETPFHAVN